MPPKRGERGRSSRGGSANAPPPAARPAGASRFAPSASYIASHSTAPPPPPVQPVAYSGYPMTSAQLGEHYPVPAGPPVVPQPPPALLHRPTPPPPPAPYASYAGAHPGPAAYSGRGPGPAFVPAPTAPPPKAAWPPPKPVAYERQAYSRTPSVPPVDSAPSRPTPPPSLVPSYCAPAPPSSYPPSAPPPASSAQSSRAPSAPPAIVTPFQHLSTPAIPATVPASAATSKPTPPPPPPPAPPAANVTPSADTPANNASEPNASKPSIAPPEPSPSPHVAQSVAAPQPQADAPTVTVSAAAEATLSSSDSDSSDDSSSSSSSGDSDESDSDDDDEVAGALVGERPRSRPVEEEEDTKEVSVDEAVAKETSDSDSDSTSDSESEKEEMTAEDENAVSDLEEAVQEQVDQDDDHGQDETLPFDLGSADEADEHEDDEEDGEGVDDSLEHVAANARRKRRRLDSVGHASTVAGDDAMSDISRGTSRAVSVDPSHVHDLTLSPTRLASLPHQVSDQALPPSANFSASTSTPARPVLERDSAAPPSPLADPSLLILPQKRPLEEEDDDDIEEGEVVSDDDAASSTAPAYPPFHAFAGAASLASRAPFDRAASAPYDHAADASMDMGMSFADLPADLLADPSRRAAGAISIPISSRASSAAPSAASGPVSETGKASYVGKASYERKKAAPSPVDLSGGTPVPPKGGVPHPAAGKLSYKPSPLSKPADLSATSTSTAPVKAVYVRRKDASTSSAPAASAAPATTSSTAVAAAGQVKAVYERPAGAAVTAAPARPAKNKKNKARGVMPFTKEEKRERLPAKIFSAFGEFATLESASDSAIFDVPHHTVLPAKNLPPPNEAAQHGFWPGPPNRKEALKKAIFPAPPELLEDVDDDRPRVEVFIDNSNVLYSFLNWVRARPEAKITSTKLGAQKGKDGKPQPAKTLKTVTIAGKKVKLDYKMLFALLERGRRVERRVLVGSSTLWQSLEPAVEWGYEISLLQRVPRAEPSTSASHTVAVAAQATQQQQGGKKRKQGNKKAPPLPPPPQPEASQTKHYKEQAVDELVHLKILESLLDFDPPPMPPPSPTPAPAVFAPTPTAPDPVVAPVADAPEPVAAPEAMAVDPPAALEATPVVEAQPSVAEFTSDNPTSTESGKAVTAERSTVEPLIETANAVNPTPLVQPAEEIADEAPAKLEDAGAATEGAPSSGGAARAADANEDGDTSMAQTQASDRVALEDDDAASTASSVAAPAPSSGSPTVLSVIAPSPAPSPALAPNTSTSAATVPAKPRFVPSSAYLTGSAQPSSTPDSTATSTQPKFVPAQPKITPAQPRITPAPPKIVPAAAKIVPAQPKPPAVVQFVPRRPPRDRPVLVIVTGDANSSEYNPGGFLGCVRRALDRGWDVEIAAFTHGISSLWTGEQMKRTTSDGRRRGELRVIDLALFAEELVMA